MKSESTKQLFLYNSLSRRKEVFTAQFKKRLNLFVCGPTVYDYIHLGNARTYVTFDLVVRYLRFLGFKVFYLQNITDIDDKIIMRAKERGITARALAQTYERAYHRDEKALRITSVDLHARATSYIKDIVTQVTRLIETGHAYKIDGDGYYFDIMTFPNYGNLARRTALQAEDSVSRIDESVAKRNKGDFALWKFSKPGEPSWKTPLGEGRPGWHIEDTAITEHHFGPQYDIHGAAIDLIFPHHEAEIAQQESASGKQPMVNLWMHSEFLLIRGEKMSKSLNNFVTVSEFLKKHSVNVFRFLVASHHYRTKIDYDEALAVQATQSLETVREFLAKLDFMATAKRRAPSSLQAKAFLIDFKSAFQAAMDDDLNTPQAFAALFGLINQINPSIWGLTKAEARALKAAVESRLSKIFAIEFPPVTIPSTIRALATKRELFRTHKQFIQADALRKKIHALGYKVEDTPVGPFVIR